MSISEKLIALKQDIDNARDKIVEMGGTVTSGGGSSQLATDLATIPVGGQGPQLTTPLISAGSDSGITSDSSKLDGRFCTGFAIYADGTKVAEEPGTPYLPTSNPYRRLSFYLYNLTTPLSAQVHNISVKAIGTNMADSEMTNSITTYPISTTLTNCKYRDSSSEKIKFVNTNNSSYIYISPNSGYKLPTSASEIVYSGCTLAYTDYGTSGYARLRLYNPTSNVSVAIAATLLPQLSAPTNLAVDPEYKVTWDAVEGAGSYALEVEGTTIVKTINKTTNYYQLTSSDLDKLTPDVEYTVKVKAVGVTSVSRDSEYSTKVFTKITPLSLTINVVNNVKAELRFHIGSTNHIINAATDSGSTTTVLRDITPTSGCTLQYNSYESTDLFDYSASNNAIKPQTNTNSTYYYSITLSSAYYTETTLTITLSNVVKVYYRNDSMYKVNLNKSGWSGATMSGYSNGVVQVPVGSGYTLEGIETNFYYLANNSALSPVSGSGSRSYSLSFNSWNYKAASLIMSDSVVTSKLYTELLFNSTYATGGVVLSGTDIETTYIDLNMPKTVMLTYGGTYSITRDASSEYQLKYNTVQPYGNIITPTSTYGDTLTFTVGTTSTIPYAKIMITDKLPPTLNVSINSSSSNTLYLNDSTHMSEIIWPGETGQKFTFKDGEEVIITDMSGITSTNQYQYTVTEDPGIQTPINPMSGKGNQLLFTTHATEEFTGTIQMEIKDVNKFFVYNNRTDESIIITDGNPSSGIVGPINVSPESSMPIPVNDDVINCKFNIRTENNKSFNFTSGGQTFTTPTLGDAEVSQEFTFTTNPVGTEFLSINVTDKAFFTLINNTGAAGKFVRADTNEEFTFTESEEAQKFIVPTGLYDIVFNETVEFTYTGSNTQEIWPVSGSDLSYTFWISTSSTSHEPNLTLTLNPVERVDINFVNNTTWDGYLTFLSPKKKALDTDFEASTTTDIPLIYGRTYEVVFGNPEDYNMARYTILPEGQTLITTRAGSGYVGKDSDHLNIASSYEGEKVTFTVEQNKSEN